ncbi:hypothetical protein Bbelb_207880 [Branchiostoma belcheri]|nr:hypothetical protein Bbelb_207880 [Branchiostoma belcheri]
MALAPVRVIANRCRHKSGKVVKGSSGMRRVPLMRTTHHVPASQPVESRIFPRTAKNVDRTSVRCSCGRSTNESRRYKADGSWSSRAVPRVGPLPHSPPTLGHMSSIHIHRPSMGPDLAQPDRTGNLGHEWRVEDRPGPENNGDTSAVPEKLVGKRKDDGAHELEIMTEGNVQLSSGR